MNRKLGVVFAGLFGLAALTLTAAPVFAQMQDVKPKPPMYGYTALWKIPRTHWSEMPQTVAADKAIMDKALADGTIIGYGDDENLVHSGDSQTHDNWWSSMSMAGLLKVLNQLYAAGNTRSPAIDAATGHWDGITVSHYYNWRPGSFKSAYTFISEYELKPDAPDDAVDTLSKAVIVPLLEKMIADGTLIEYEIDELAVHTEAPGTFGILCITPTPEGIDKIFAAIRGAVKAQPLIGPAFGSMTKGSAHRNLLLFSEGVYK
jgi:hypothetical protein